MIARRQHLPALKHLPEWLVQRPRMVVVDVGLASAAVLLLIALSIQNSPFSSAMPLANEGVQLPPLPSRLHTSSSQTLATIRSSLGKNQPLARRLVAMTTLEQMGVSAIPTLIVLVSDPDPSIRLAAVQVLGSLRASQAAEALLGATFDPSRQVREAAIRALGDSGAFMALPRLQQLQIVQSNFYIQQAAYLAEQELQDRVAQELGLGLSEVHALAVAPANQIIYAVTTKGLYGNRGQAWSPLAGLPDDPLDVVATSADGSLVYVATAAGLTRSDDGGTTWQLVRSVLPLLIPSRVTAVTIDPLDERRVYIAVASTTGRAVLGIYVTTDGGSTWSPLPEAPLDYVTNRLTLDWSAPEYLFGGTGVGTWRYRLSDE